MSTKTIYICDCCKVERELLATYTFFRISMNRFGYDVCAQCVQSSKLLMALWEKRTEQMP